MEASCRGGGLVAGCCCVHDLPSHVQVSPDASPPKSTATCWLESYAIVAANLGDGPVTDACFHPALLLVQVSPKYSNAEVAVGGPCPPKMTSSERSES